MQTWRLVRAQPSRQQRRHSLVETQSDVGRFALQLLDSIRDSGPLLQPTNVMCRGRKRRSMLSAADAIPRTPKSMTPPAVNPKEDDMQRLPKIERDDISGDLAHFYDAVTRLPGHWRWTAALNGRSSIASHGACDMVR